MPDVFLIDHRLNTTVMDERQAMNAMDCVTQCVLHPKCRSVNYRKNMFIGQENCHLLHPVASEEPPEQLLEDEECDHFLLRNPLRASIPHMTFILPLTLC